MNVNDKRNVSEKVPFGVLKVGQAYEDKSGVLCIKTVENDFREDFNCICFVSGKWKADLESLDTVVTPLVTTLEIER